MWKKLEEMAKYEDDIEDWKNRTFEERAEAFKTLMRFTAKVLKNHPDPDSILDFQDPPHPSYWEIRRKNLKKEWKK